MESTIHLISYGTDIYYNRVQPSKEFDLLPDHFSKGWLLVSCLGLIIFTIIAKWYSKRSQFQTMW